MTALEHNHDSAAYVLAANDRLASAAQEIARLRTSLAAAEKVVEAGNKWKDSDDPVDAIALANALAALDAAKEAR